MLNKYKLMVSDKYGAILLLRVLPRQLRSHLIFYMINIAFNRSKIEMGFWIFLKEIMEAKPVLLCIPDISGFTHFMGDIDFELSAKVVPALLNNIIYSNEINLNISEIEGDAVLFYRSGPVPTLKAIIDQSTYFLYGVLS